MKYLRRVANKTKRDRERSSKIREDLKVTPLAQEIEIKQLRWFGHVSRMSKERLPKKCIEARLDGKRSRGRPRTTWTENITKLGNRRGKTLTEMKRMAKNREEWKSFIRKAPTL